jgi:hypothetical protein
MKIEKIIENLSLAIETIQEVEKLSNTIAESKQSLLLNNIKADKQTIAKIAFIVNNGTVADWSDLEIIYQRIVRRKQI